MAKNPRIEISTETHPGELIVLTLMWVGGLAMVLSGIGGHSHYGERSLAQDIGDDFVGLEESNTRAAGVVVMGLAVVAGATMKAARELRAIRMRIAPLPEDERPPAGSPTEKAFKPPPEPPPAAPVANLMPPKIRPMAKPVYPEFDDAPRAVKKSARDEPL